MAIPSFTAFSRPSREMTFRAVSPSRTISTMRRPEARAARRRSAMTAGIMLVPGRHMPMASATAHMVLAVPRKEQEPQEGLESASSRLYSS